jgi:hypothetical protein
MPEIHRFGIIFQPLTEEAARAMYVHGCNERSAAEVAEILCAKIHHAAISLGVLDVDVRPLDPETMGTYPDALWAKHALTGRYIQPETPDRNPVRARRQVAELYDRLVRKVEDIVALGLQREDDD